MKYIGLHISTAGGIYKSLERARRMDINAIQIFLKNPTRWKSIPYSHEDIRQFKLERQTFKHLKIFAHTGYLINLSARNKIFFKSFRSMLDEMERADLLGIDYLVIHPGSHKGEGEDYAIHRIAETLDRIYKRMENTGVKILLETTAGKGTSLGYRFEHLRDIMDLSKCRKRLFVCLDTCHIFVAGYPIFNEEGYNSVIEEFNRVIGLKKLKLIHLNDSKKEFGSRLDKHDHIGKGEIGDEGFRLILNDNRLRNIPIILETPRRLITDTLMKEIPMTYETSKKIGISIPDTVKKEISIIFDKSKKFGTTFSETLLKDTLMIMNNSKKFSTSISNILSNLIQKNFKTSREKNIPITETLLGDLVKIIIKSREFGISVSEILSKDATMFLDNSRKQRITLSDIIHTDLPTIINNQNLSISEVDYMNLQKVYSLLNHNEKKHHKN